MNMKELLRKALEEEEANEEGGKASEGEAEKPEEAKEEEKSVSFDVKALADSIGDKLAKAMLEAKGITAEADHKDLKEKLFSPRTGMKGISLPKSLSDLDSYTKEDRIAMWFKAMLTRHESQESDMIFKALVEGTDADGGYLVPEEFRAEVFRLLPDASVMRRIARILPMNTDTLNLNTLTAEPMAYWTSEYASKSTTSAEFGRVTLTPYKLVCLLPVTQELAMDANIDIVRFIVQLFVEKIGAVEDKAFFTGSGSGQPQGIANCSGIRTTAAGGVLNFDDILSQVYDMKQAVRQSSSAAFVATRKVISILHKVKDSNGRYIWTPAATSQVDTRPLDMILGYPIYEQNDLSEDQLYFGDWSKYIIGDRQSISVSTTTEGGDAWRRDSIEIKAKERVDGKCVLASAFNKMTGIQS